VKRAARAGAMLLGQAAASAGVMAVPQLARSTTAATLKFVPRADLALLDPIQSPVGATIMHSLMVFDTLRGWMKITRRARGWSCHRG